MAHNFLMQQGNWPQRYDCAHLDRIHSTRRSLIVLASQCIILQTDATPGVLQEVKLLIEQPC